MHATAPSSTPAPPLGPVPVVLAAEAVEKVYPNGTLALSGTSLQIRRGEFVSLLGPSGCGKSTLLRMFAGLEVATGGRAEVHHEAQAADGRPSLGMVFQEATLMPWARVAENVRLPLKLAGVPRQDSEPRVQQALAQVGLSAFAQAYPRELSGGMQMRVSIARALVVQPRILLMDEPFGALDEFTRHKLDSDLHQLWRERGFTTVFVTHSIYEAVFFSSRVLVMAARPGRVIADVAIDGPAERGESFRVSAPFFEQCRVLSDHLAQAMRGAP